MVRHRFTSKTRFARGKARATSSLASAPEKPPPGTGGSTGGSWALSESSPRSSFTSLRGPDYDFGAGGAIQPGREPAKVSTSKQGKSRSTGTTFSISRGNPRKSPARKGNSIRVDESAEDPTVSVISKQTSAVFSRLSSSMTGNNPALSGGWTRAPDTSQNKRNTMPAVSTPKRPPSASHGSPTSVVDQAGHPKQSATFSSSPQPVAPWERTVTSSPAAPSPGCVVALITPPQRQSHRAQRRNQEQERAARLYRQRDYWQRIVWKRVVLRGPSHTCTADAFVHLGDAQMAMQMFPDAVKSFTSAKKAYEAAHGSSHLTVARALDKLGHAMTKAGTSPTEALGHLETSLKIRSELLGTTHVDTIDTLNHIATIRMQFKQYTHAINNYHAVLCWRESIFGRAHASVAVTATNLANALHRGLRRADQAREFYRIALDSYLRAGASQNSRPVKELRFQLGTSSSSSSSSCDASLTSIREDKASVGGGNSYKLDKFDSDIVQQPKSFTTLDMTDSSDEASTVDGAPQSNRSFLVEI